MLYDSIVQASLLIVVYFKRVYVMAATITSSTDYTEKNEVVRNALHYSLQIFNYEQLMRT